MMKRGAWFGGMLLLASCSMIDDDLSNCQKEIVTEYELKLITNVTTELETVLSTEYDLPLQMELREELSHIFTDYARDVDLSFYGSDSLRHLHETHVMNANEASYTLTLPVEEYDHLALANIAQQRQVDYTLQESCHTAYLDQKEDLPNPAVPEEGDFESVIDSHETGIFTARQQIKILGNQSQQFNVRLYMANCAAALVVDTTGYHIRDMKVYIEDLADGFGIRDSLYSYRRHTAVRTFPVEVKNLSRAFGSTRADDLPNNYRQVCYCGVGFPSRNKPLPGVGKGNTYWRVRAYVTQDDGRVTENVFQIEEPLNAGNLKIIRCRVTANGVTEATSPRVGVSVTLDWKPGNIYTPEV